MLGFWYFFPIFLHVFLKLTNCLKTILFVFPLAFLVKIVLSNYFLRRKGTTCTFFILYTISFSLNKFFINRFFFVFIFILFLEFRNFFFTFIQNVLILWDMKFRQFSSKFKIYPLRLISKKGKIIFSVIYVTIVKLD